MLEKQPREVAYIGYRITDCQDILFTVRFCQKTAQCCRKIYGTYFSGKPDGQDEVNTTLQENRHTKDRDKFI